MRLPRARQLQVERRRGRKTLSGIRAAGGDGEALQFDVASGEESTAAIEAWQKAHEGACIEVVVNNAGIRDDVLMMWMEPQQWHSVIGAGLDGFTTSRGRCSRGCS